MLASDLIRINVQNPTKRGVNGQVLMSFPDRIEFRTPPLQLWSPGTVWG